MSEKTVVVVDQFTKRVGTVQRRGWYRIGSNPTIETSNSWYKVTVLGAVTDDGDSFYCWTEENLTSKQGIWLLGALQEKFGEELVVFLDRAGYFYNRDRWEHVSDEHGNEGNEEHLDVWYFPSKLPELNPVEGRWDRLNEWFKHRLIPGLSALKQQIQRGLSTVSEPNIWNNLCP
ncbi:transposase [Natronomonas sp. F2-12]|uniref:Transposase n=1 Tax=Natronomonas aquatica TaxID=2841590 RepID=A0A9R1D4A1_9EURY|nr:transposase [Natronomonas aquatica]MCQ4333134.1 transposase [Natronomonas aquatica]